jgi:hypothetical protein
MRNVRILNRRGPLYTIIIPIGTNGYRFVLCKFKEKSIQKSKNKLINCLKIEKEHF